MAAAGETAIGQLVIYDGSTNARDNPNELTTALNALYGVQPAPVDVAAFLKERGFVDAAGACRTRGLTFLLTRLFHFWRIGFFHARGPLCWRLAPPFHEHPGKGLRRAIANRTGN